MARDLGSRGRTFDSCHPDHAGIRPAENFRNKFARSGSDCAERLLGLKSEHTTEDRTGSYRRGIGTQMLIPNWRCRSADRPVVLVQTSSNLAGCRIRTAGVSVQVRVFAPYAGVPQEEEGGFCTPVVGVSSTSTSSSPQGQSSCV